jgi:hypothetical protein
LVDPNVPKYHTSETTYGKIISSAIVKNDLCIYTTQGGIKIYDNGMCNSHNVPSIYLDFDNITSVTTYKDNIYIGTNDGLVTRGDGTTIKNHGPCVKVRMLIHNDKLYSTGADHCIRVTNL